MQHGEPFQLGIGRIARQRARGGRLRGVVRAPDESLHRGGADAGVRIVEPSRHGVGRGRRGTERDRGANRGRPTHAIEAGRRGIDHGRRHRLRLEPPQRVGVARDACNSGVVPA
jgi:hypothetical protein